MRSAFRQKMDKFMSEQLTTGGEISVGTTIWIFDNNRRVYLKDPQTGLSCGSPIWREHWVKATIADENSRSWITQRGIKIPKKGPLPKGMSLSEEDIENKAFVIENALPIADRVRAISDHEILKKVAELIGYSV
jgi:hypothetical protein